MFRSSISDRFAAGLAAGVFGVALATASPVASAETVRIYTSTFNEFSNAILPVTLTGRYKLTFTIDLGWLGRHTITLCNSAYSATVSTLTFGISTSAVTAGGKVSARWCNITFGDSQLSATGNVYYSAGDDNVHFTFTSASVKPCASIRFSAIDQTLTVCLPVSINVAPTLNIPPLAIGIAVISHGSPTGQRAVFMTPNNISLVKRNGYLEFQTDVSFW
ncbi:MAG: hypothetical protein OEM83_06305 [Gammaproteobacteria bacterium]|nr:hypothetical protein [Gammaproteobacteria bacterium]MDH5512256.1 hypothetical protein [Gammaproteobacteria bacterium]